MEDDAEVHVDEFALGLVAADDNEGFGLCAREREVEFGESGAEVDFLEYERGLFVGDEAVAEDLLVACRGGIASHADEFAEGFARDFVGGVVAPAAAVALEELLDGDAHTFDFGLLGAESLLVAFFEVVVCHSGKN